MLYTQNYRYDVIVVGAGHAGCEAAAAAAQLGSKTLLITLDMNRIAQMSCNPAVGGIAKGQIVREIDALGGRMGLITDRTAIQFRMLNRSKGPAMWSPRAQNDRMRFSEAWRQELEQQENLEIYQDEVKELLLEGNKKVRGVRTLLGTDFYAPSVVLTVGTFLGGLMHFGEIQIPGGRISEPASLGLTRQLSDLGFSTDRMKTGTPARIDARSICFEECSRQDGEDDFHRFSFLDTTQQTKLAQRPCFITYTNEQVHEILRKALDRSPLYNGQIQSIGPRYCPSIETKIVTFADKPAHQIFLEPEGETTTEYYVNGFSSSLPPEVQLEAMRAIPALRHVRFFRPGYAIEYDFFDPTQLNPTLETMIVEGLFFAGQINGTTGYEEAAGQGLLAGINAHLKNNHYKKEFILHRDEAYIGVLIDDLVTKGVDEPYRMFTSRAEHRILLRQDNADYRLTPKAIELGLASTRRSTIFSKKSKACNELIHFAETYSVLPENINCYLEQISDTPIRQKTKLKELILRPNLNITDIAMHVPALSTRIEQLKELREEVSESVEIALKYEGYIKREQQQAEKLRRLEEVRIPTQLCYEELLQLSTEARQKLSHIRPITIGQAARIPGISPHDISILLVICGR
ncbi:MAG: tRNA uridine-5-carboxymethylaminomethyl(34) synthesis enzyme MnmG [Porphyromonas sp.]|nr:tRNA uridine-5-carboxymethylaminomethyl(34) synthesis enzyme MnmG [Porphyromonas sp.]